MISIASIFIDGQKVVKGPYSRDFRGKKVKQAKVREVPPGCLHFYVLGAEGEKVLKCMEKEEFKAKASRGVKLVRAF